MDQFKKLKKKLTAEAILRAKYDISFFVDTIINMDCAICSDSIHRKPSMTTPNEIFYCRHCILMNVIDYKRAESPSTNKPFKKKSSFNL